MVVSSIRRRAVAAVVIGSALLATGCTAAITGEGVRADAPECAPYKPYQGHSGKSVTVLSTIRDVEAAKFQQAWRHFADCTGIDVRYEGIDSFETEIQTRVDAGKIPDVAFFPQPGLLARFVEGGKVKPAPATTKEMAEKYFSKDWLGYGTIDDTFYAAPLDSSVKSFVWYSPKFFKDKGYAVPKSWDEMVALSNKIAATGQKPWCAGIASGEATGWPATDWMEDVMLRVHGPEVYDDWVAHKVPFNDTKVVEVAEKVASILKNPRYLNNVKSVATIDHGDAGLPILRRKCAMYRQASFYANAWPKGTKVAEDGDVWAFYFPAIDPSKGQPVLGGGSFVAAFSDRPEVRAFQTFLATAEFATARAKLGAFVSANTGVPLDTYEGAVDKLSAQILQDPNAVFRFDGSDLMPAAVGAGTFWKGMTDWIKGQDTRRSLDYIERSWPQ